MTFFLYQTITFFKKNKGRARKFGLRVFFAQKFNFQPVIDPKHLKNTIDALINSYVTYNNPKIGPKNQNQPKIIVKKKKLLHVRFTFLSNLKMKEYLSKTLLIECNSLTPRSLFYQIRDWEIKKIKF